MDIRYMWKYAWKKSRRPNGDRGTHEIPATSQFMVRRANQLSYGLWWRLSELTVSKL